MAMSGHEGMSEVDHPDEVFQIETLQNINDGGYLAMSPNYSSPFHGEDATKSDSRHTDAAMLRSSELLFVVSMHAEPTRTNIIDLAHSAMEELSKIGVAGRPLWIPQKDEKYETLNDIEYLRRFGEVDETLKEIMRLVEVKESPNATLQIEASRDMAYVNITPINLVELLMDVNQWSKAFYNLVSRTKVLGTLSDEVEGGGYDGKVHVMWAEYHLPSPLVPTRECYFARYCKQLPNDTNEMWGVVDVSLEKPIPFITSSNLRRRPSGCLITGMPNGCSKVIWLEHVESDHTQGNNDFRPLLTTDLAFGATRWLDSLIRHIVFSETMKATTTPLHADHWVVITQAGRKSLLNLADRLMRSYCADVNASVSNPWMQIAEAAGSIDVRVMVKNNVEDPGMPHATTVVFGTSIWLNVSPSRLFNFLRHQDARNKWDVLSRNLNIREFAYMTKGNNPGNRVSLLQAMTREGKVDIFYLQESYRDSTSWYVIYAPIDEFALLGLANGMNPDNVMVLPSGFSILPGNNGSGSLLTVVFHVIESFNIRSHIPPESAVTIHRLVTDTVTSIKDVVLFKNRVDDWEQH